MKKTLFTLLAMTALSVPVVSVHAQTNVKTGTEANVSANADAGFFSKLKGFFGGSADAETSQKANIDTKAESNAQINTEAGTASRTNSNIEKHNKNYGEYESYIEEDSSASAGVKAEAETETDMKAKSSGGQTRATSTNNLGVGIGIGN